MPRAERLFSVDVKIAATAYVRATSKAEAKRKVRGLKNQGFELPDAHSRFEDLEIPISGRDFSDPDLPEISLSPAMTCHGQWNHLIEDRGEIPEAETE